MLDSQNLKLICQHSSDEPKVDREVGDVFALTSGNLQQTARICGLRLAEVASIIRRKIDRRTVQIDGFQLLPHHAEGLAEVRQRRRANGVQPDPGDESRRTA